MSLHLGILKGKPLERSLGEGPFSREKGPSGVPSPARGVGVNTPPSGVFSSICTAKDLHIKTFDVQNLSHSLQKCELSFLLNFSIIR